MDGVLIVNKPMGMTSHDVVNRLRGVLKQKRIGHTGTLDPNATGILIVLLGKATKCLPYIHDTDKEYIAELCLGIQTKTDDIWGEVIARQDICPIDDFEGLLKTFIGQQEQLPPMVSSVKVHGKKLYEYARNNEPVDRIPRKIEIYELVCLDAQKYRFRVSCSKGTYVRSLCVDIAARSHNLGCLKSLTRSKVGRFSLADAHSLSDIEQGNYKLHEVDELLDDYPKIEANDPQLVYNGKPMTLDRQDELVAITEQGKIIAIYRHEDVHTYVCQRGLW